MLKVNDAINALNSVCLTITANTKPFDKLKDNGFSSNTNLRQTSASFYQLLTSVGVIGIVMSIIVCGIMFATTKDARKRSEVKSHFMVKGIIAVILFAFIWLIGQVMSVTTQLV